MVRVIMFQIFNQKATSFSYDYLEWMLSQNCHWKNLDSDIQFNIRLMPERFHVKRKFAIEIDRTLKAFKGFFQNWI